VVTTVQQASHLNYTTATVTFQGLATNGTNSPTAAKTGGIYNCSNVYCHVANRPAGTGPNQSGIATSPVPVWNDTALIGGTTIADTCAAKCHGLPPGALQAGDNNHSALAVVTTFSGLTTCSCHNAVINTGATSFATIFSDRSKHINGVVDASNGHVLPYPGSTHMNAAGATTPASTCGVCHNTTLAGPYPATTLGSAPNCMGCHKLGLLRTVATSSCYDCHGASATDGRPNGAVFPNYSGSHSKHVVTMGYTCASCHANGGTGSANHGPSNRINSTGIAFVHVTSTTRDFHFTPVGKGSCSTAYCHSSGQSVSGTSATPVYVVVTWGGTALCGSCHATTSIASGSHTKHLSVSTNCGNCHTGSSETAYSSASHVNRLIDVGVGSYSAGGAPGNGYGTCTTALCHSNGATTPVYKPATWGTANTAACNFCHDALPTTGSHSIHIANYSFGCAECHGHNGTGSAHIDGSVQIVAAVGYNGS
jgi:predicted CxxxxCH...CXXCH cytochrome family protein